MVYFSVVLGIGIIAAMVFMALDKKSSFAVRVVSLAALALMILTVIICLFLVLTDDRVPVDESVVIVGAVPETQKKSTTNVMVLLLFIIFLAGIFVLLVFFSMREHHRNFPKANS